MKTKLLLLAILLFSLFSFSQPGSLDTSFDLDGKKVISFSNQNDYGEFVLIQPSDSKIIVGGKSSLTGGNLSFSLARLNLDGTFDTTFDTDGKVTTTYGTEGFEAVAGALQTDGKIVVVGTSVINSSLGTAQVALVRYNPNGSLDTDFDTDGIVLTQVSASNEDYGVAVKIQSNGKIVVGVQSRIEFNYEFVLLRYNSNGSLDTDFDTDGKVITNLPKGENIFDIELQNDKIIAVGYQGNSNDDVFAARYSSNGSLDTSFGTNGFFTYDFASNHNYATSVAITSDNKIVVGGRYANGAGYSPFVLRLTSNGALDTGFDSDGILIQTTDGSIDDVVLQSDDKIITIGTVDIATVNSKIGVSKINTNGIFDTSFGTNGKVETQVIETSSSGNNGALQPDGKIVVVGSTYTSVSLFSKYAVVRYDNDAPLSINSFSNLFFKMYPNPSNGNFTIHVSDIFLGSKAIIYNLLGQSIKEFIIDEVNQNAYLENGVYMLQIQKGNQVSTKKIIIQ
jgi:uncharacterized delta-60 repeat protein